MNLAAAIQAQLLQSLLQAMQAADSGLKAGASLRAVFTGWATPDGQAPAEGERGQAQALIAGKPVTLTLGADAARVAALKPGAVMTIAVDESPTGSRPAEARLVAVAPPEGEGLKRAASASQGDITARAAKAATPTDPALAAGLAARAVAGPIVGAVLAKQDGYGPLFANLAALGEAAEDPALARQLAALPPGLAQAARQVLRQALPLEAATPDALRQAVGRSGVFHEANLARGSPGLAGDDLKSALMALKSLLTASAPGETPAPSLPGRAQPSERPPQPDGKNTTSAAPPPQPRAEVPRRDGLPLPQPEVAPTVGLGEDAPSAILARLTEQTSSALDRLSLAQFSSLPTPQDGASVQNRWFVELPLAPGSGAAVLPLEIEEDRGGGAAGEARPKVWRVRFALDLEPMGLIHALVTMQAKAVSVAVWAEREATSRLVRDFAPDLEAALKEAEFDEASIDVLSGRPASPPTTPGRYLDRAS